MIHYTLNTGDSRVSQRSEVADAAIAALRPLLDRGGQLPHPFTAYRVKVSHAPGGAVFSMYRHTHPIVLCAVAWDPSTAERIWHDIERTYLQMGDRPHEIAPAALAEMPATLPWCAVIILPTIMLEARTEVGWIGDFERCFAWALIEK